MTRHARVLLHSNNLILLFLTQECWDLMLWVSSPFIRDTTEYRLKILITHRGSLAFLQGFSQMVRMETP